MLLEDKDRNNTTRGVVSLGKADLDPLRGVVDITLADGAFTYATAIITVTVSTITRQIWLKIAC